MNRRIPYTTSMTMAILLLAGCLSETPQDTSSGDGPLSWRDACAKEWETYTVDWNYPPPEHPPKVDGLLCNVLPTEDGDLYLTNLPRTSPGISHAAAVPNGAGSYDWIGIQDQDLVIWENETKEIRVLVGEIDLDDFRELWAAVLDNGETHVVVSGWFGEGIATTVVGKEPVIEHYWWANDNEIRNERLVGDFFFFSNNRLTTDGSTLALAMPHHLEYGGISKLYWTTSGSFNQVDFPGIELQFAVPHDGNIYACGTSMGSLVLFQKSNDWSPEFVADVDPLGPLCQVTITFRGPLITFVGVPLVGDSPVRDEYQIALKEGNQWMVTPLGMHSWSFRDLTSANGVAYHLHTTGSRPGPDGKPTDMIEMRSPQDESLHGRWTKIWGYDANERTFLDVDGTIAVSGERWTARSIDGRQVSFPLGVLHLDYEPPFMGSEENVGNSG